MVVLCFVVFCFLFFVVVVVAFCWHVFFFGGEGERKCQKCCGEGVMKIVDHLYPVNTRRMHVLLKNVFYVV